MQHYRLPTRLLDWTELPLCALYFAVTDLPDKDGALWILSPFGLNKAATGAPVLSGPHSAPVASLMTKAFDSASKPTGQVLAIAPWEADVRMLLQASTFTIHDGPSPLESSEHSTGVLYKYRILKDLKPQLRRELEMLGVRRSTLFPDLENLALELSELTFSEDPPSVIAAEPGPPAVT